MIENQSVAREERVLPAIVLKDIGLVISAILLATGQILPAGAVATAALALSERVSAVIGNVGA